MRILQLPKQTSPEWTGGWPVGADDDLERTSHPPIIDITIPADSWASIVASVSEGGEGDYRFFAAKAFHDSEGEIEIMPKGKSAPITGLAEAVKVLNEHCWQNRYDWVLHPQTPKTVLSRYDANRNIIEGYSLWSEDALAIANYLLLTSAEETK